MSPRIKTGKITNLLKFIDLFGVEPKINIQQSEKFNTIFGGLISILFYISILLGFFYFSQELVTKSNPTVILSNQYDIEPKRFDLTNNKFNFFIAIQDENSAYYIDYSIFTVKIRLKTTTRTLDSEGKPSYTYDTQYPRLEICNITRHFPNFVQQFTGSDLSTSICVNPEDSDKFIIQGQWDSANYTSVIMDIFPCTNSTTSDIVCKPQQDIDQKLRGGFFSIQIIDTIFDPKNYTQPYQYISRNFYTSMSKDFFKVYTLYFKNIDYSTDSGFFLQDPSTKHYLQLDYISELMDFRKTPQFFSCLLRTSNNRDMYNRMYVKIQDILANMGGLIEGILLCIEITLMLYQHANYYTFLIDNLFCPNVLPTFPSRETLDRSMINLQNNNNHTKTINVNNFIENRGFSSEFTISQKIKEIDSRRKKITNLSTILCLPLLECFGKKTPNLHYYEIGKRKIEENTDIIKVFNLAEEIELIKKILFKDGSVKLINFLMKNQVLSINDKPSAINYDELCSHYNNLNTSEIEISLKNVFDMKLNAILNNNINY
jgi:hypothetical protein